MLAMTSSFRRVTKDQKFEPVVLFRSKIKTDN